MILGFDTATRATTVALLDPAAGIELEERDDPAAGARPRHATRLLAMVAEVLEQAGADWEGIEKIAVGVGPGTFTGLRIGVASARALARSRGLGLVGVSTLASLASGVSSEHTGPIAAVLDARRGEVFMAVWAQSGERLLDPVAISPDGAAARLSELGGGALAIGDGAVEFRSVLERAGASVPGADSSLHRVTAINHCRLAGSLEAVAPDAITPDYLRVPDAELGRRAKQSQ